ncbi:MAG TPA: hypothetical protein VGR37_06135 [Longimicrobiaceae bacterium]|nr:hypothetical protein [Longimicrobiaceae bacterium]
MTKPAVFTLLVVVVSVLVALAGTGMAGPEARTGVVAGAAIGGAFQLLSYWALLVLLPGRQMLGFGLGMLGRFALVAVVALVVLPLAGLPGAPTLFTLVSVLFATTLLEPVFLAADTRKSFDDR